MAKQNKKRSLLQRIFGEPEYIRWLKNNPVVKALGVLWVPLTAVVKIALGAISTVLLIVVVCGFVFAGILGDYLQSDILPNAAVVLDDYAMDAPSYVYNVSPSGEIELLQELYASTDWKKADYDDIPEALIHAAVAIEDKRFYEHQGVDWFTTIKAFANMFFGSETVGGSSITQQLIKNKTGKDSVTVQRKVQEFFSATLVEKNNDKKVIIEEYLNSIYMGQGCRGVKSAAASYFGKELQLLTIAECASLISITNNPSLFDPYSQDVFTYEGEERNGMERNLYRQRLVLGEMFKQGYITQEEYDTALAQELVLKNGVDEGDQWLECSNPECTYENIRSTFYADSGLVCPQCGTVPETVSNASQEVYSYFVDAVIKDVARDLALQDGITEWNNSIWEDYMDKIGRGGYHIYTTMDTTVQAQVDSIYKDLSKIPKTRSAQQLQSAIVVVDNSTGDIVAMAGGVGDEKVHFGFNRATQAELQSGSSIKPLTIYAPGFEQGSITPASVIKDMPIDFSDGVWPRNDNRVYNYSSTVFNGVVRSVNAVAANTLDKIGTNYGYEFAKESFGLSTLTDRDLQFSSLALGAQYYGVTVRDMTCAFATFANNGVYRKGRTYTKIYDSKGNIVLDNTQVQREILGEKSVNYMNYCLTNAVESGTGAGADFYTVDIAGKTGSTSSFRDRWFCGFTGYYTAAVWCGYDTPEVINTTGGSYNPASKLWNDVMKPLHAGKDNIPLYDKRLMTSVSVCLDSGLLATDACKADVRGSRVASALVYPEDIPKAQCNKHVMVDYCAAGGGVAAPGCPRSGQKSLCKITVAEMQLIKNTIGFGLGSEYYRDDFVYLVDSSGNDAEFFGFNNNINIGLSAPYKMCPGGHAPGPGVGPGFGIGGITKPTNPGPVVPDDPDVGGDGPGFEDDPGNSYVPGDNQNE